MAAVLTRLGARDAALVAVWCGAVAGLLDGLEMFAVRFVPRIRGPFKVPPEVLWVAPVVAIVLFLLALPALLLVARPVARRRGIPEQRLLVSLYALVAAFCLLFAPRVLHPASVVVLAVGIALAVTRWFTRREAAAPGWMLRRAWVVPVAMVFMAAGVLLAGRLSQRTAFATLPAAPVGARNVLILMLDTVRRDRVATARGAELAPRLKQLAAAGTEFRQAWASSSWSLPSQASVLAGRYPFEHGADWPKLAIAAGTPTLASFLAGQGYATGAFSGNSAWIVPEHVGRGFGTFTAYQFEIVARRTAIGALANFLLDKLGWDSSGRGRTAAALQRDLLAFLDAHPGRPFFAYLCFMDANQAMHRRTLGHPFWQSAPALDSIVAAYEGGIRSLDASIGVLLDTLRQRGVLDNTIVVVTSDHGESFGRRYPGDHAPGGHGTSLYPEQVAVPLIIIEPGRPGGRVVDTTVGLHQLAATLAHRLGFGGAPFGGPLLPLDSAASVPRPVLATLAYDNRDDAAVMADPWFYLATRRDPGTPGRLFDLREDPSAQAELPAEHPMRTTLRTELVRLLRDGSGAAAPVTALREAAAAPRR